MAEWTAAFINDLPDASFLYVEPGGEKDGDGKTTPRSLRHFPYKGKDGAIDLPHLRNAIARIPQSDIPAAKKTELQAHAQKLLEGQKDSADPVPVYRLDLSSGSVGERRRTPQGGLVADANLTRTGVFEYRDAAGGVRRELRHPDEVFHADSMGTYPLAPVTIDHPGKVGPDNWRTHAVGTVGPKVRQNGNFVTGEVHIQHDDAIDRAERGELSELSCGYHCDLDPTPGTYQGKPYDAVQRRIRINHVAMGPKGWGRMGPDVKLHMDAGAAISSSESDSYVRGDSEGADMDPKDLEKAKGDLKKANDDLEKARADASSAKTEAEKAAADLRATRAENESLKAQNEVLKLQAEKARNDGVTVEQRKAEESKLQASVEELIALRADAATVFASVEDPTGKNWKADGKSADGIRREILGHLAPSVKLDSLNADGLRAVYDITMTGERRAAEERAKVQRTVNGPRLDAKKPEDGGDDEESYDADKARKDMEKRKRDAWKMPRKDRRRRAA